MGRTLLKRSFDTGRNVVERSIDMKTFLLCLRGGLSINGWYQNADVVLNALVRGNPLDETPRL